MSLFSHPDHFKSLQKLLSPPGDESDSDSDIGFDSCERPAGSRNLGPSSIGPKAVPTPAKSKGELVKIEEKPLPIDDDKNELDIWLEKQEKEDMDLLDDRKRPEYSITYKQAVGTEDVFFQMTSRTSGSMSCEDMIIEIQMPDETVGVDEMDLSVTENEIDLKSSIYRLKLPLTQPIDPDRGAAKFDKANKTLKLTLRMKREFDFVNF